MPPLGSFFTRADRRTVADGIRLRPGLAFPKEAQPNLRAPSLFGGADGRAVILTLGEAWEHALRVLRDMLELHLTLHEDMHSVDRCRADLI